jgi:hypothetical protein
MPDDSVSAILSSCRAALDSPLKNENEIVPRGHGDADAITAFQFDNFAEGDLFSRGREWTLSQHIFQRLGHLFANPSKAAEREALVRSYTYSVGDAQGVGQGRRKIVNESARGVREFVETVLAAARRQHEIRRRGATSQHQESSKGFILHGPRGVGKTFFYNFLISRFDHHFDSEEDQSIWIRLNLADPLYDADSQAFGVSNLMEWIYAQAAKIILRYYDPGSEYVRREKVSHFQRRPFEELSKHVLEADPTAKLKLDRIRTAFMRKGHDDILTSSLLPIEYTTFLFNYAQDCGYSIVIVFDGLDVLETTYNWVGKFRRIFNAVKAVYRSEVLLGAVFIAIMRTNSLRQQGNPYGGGLVPMFTIAPPDLNEIVDQRIALLKAEVPILAQTSSDWKSDDLFNKWPGHLDDFLAYLYPRSGEEGREENDFLQEIMEDDRRAQMQAIKLRYLEFLERRTESRYRMIETLMKAGMAYPPVYYRYQGAGKNLQRLGGDHIKGDLRFFPSIFRVPYIADAKRPEFKLPTEAMMVGVRVLQIAAIHDRLRAEGLDYPLQVENLAHLTSVLFNCPVVLVMNLIEEYVDFQLLRTYGRFESHSETAVTDDVSLMPKGRYLLSSALYDIAYLNLAGMRAVLDRRAFGNAKSPFMRAERFDPGSQNGLEKWIIAKMLNSISVCRLMKALNTQQQKNFPTRSAKLKLNNKPLYEAIVKEIRSNKIFEEVDSMGDRIVGRIEALVRSIQVPEHRYNLPLLEENLREYTKDWC